MDVPIPLQEALRDSITSGAFIDTKFWVFSKRNSKLGRVGEPKALFVNGRVVRSVPRLAARTLVPSNRSGSLADQFAVLDRKETKEDLRTRFPAGSKPHIDDYDYDADSDLEEDEDWDSSDIEDSQAVPEKRKSEKSNSGTSIGCQYPDAKYNEPSDVISISDVDSLLSDSTDTKAEGGVTPTRTPTHIGTVVVIDDVAFVTYVRPSVSVLQAFQSRATGSRRYFVTCTRTKSSSRRGDPRREGRHALTRKPPTLTKLRNRHRNPSTDWPTRLCRIGLWLVLGLTCW